MKASHTPWILGCLAMAGMLWASPAFAAATSQNITKLPDDGLLKATDFTGGNEVYLKGTDNAGTKNIAFDTGLTDKKLHITDRSLVTVNDTTISDTNEVRVEGASTFNSSTVQVGTGLARADLNITENSVLNVGKLEVNAQSIVKVLNSVANIGELNLKKDSIFFADPAQITIANGDPLDQVIEGSMQLGYQSMLTWGNVSNEWLKPIAASTGARGSVLGLQRALNLGTDGSIIVNNSTGPVHGRGPGAEFGKDSLLVLSMSELKNWEGTTLNSAGVIRMGQGATLTIDPSSRLYLDTVSFIPGIESYSFNLATSTGTGFGTVTGNLWQNRVYANNFLYDVSISKPDNNTISATLTVISRDSMARRMPGIASDVAGILRSMLIDPNSGNNMSLGSLYLLASANDSMFSGSQAASNINAAISLASAAGAQGVLLNTNNMVTDSITKRAGFFSNQSGIGAGSATGTGISVWTSPLYQNQKFKGKHNGLKTGYVSNSAGVLAGMDYTMDNTWRVGGALNVGAGTSRSNGTSAAVKNNFNFWGLSAYAGYNMNNLHVSADFGYEQSTNNVKMNSGFVPVEAKGVETSILTAGISTAYTIITNVVDVTPHGGVRFTNLQTENYSVKAQGKVNLFDVKTKSQNIISIPLGVTFDKVIAHPSGWLFKPGVDVGVVVNTGSLNAQTSANFGAYGNAGLKIPIADKVMFNGGLSFSATKDDFSLGLNYDLQVGKSTINHAVNATMRVGF